MKKTIVAVSLSIFVASSSLAGQSCSDQLDLIIKEKQQAINNSLSFQKKDGSRTQEGTKPVAYWGGALLLTAAAHSPIGAIAWLGYYGEKMGKMFSKEHAENMRRLFKQAADVASGGEGGKSIRKLYKRYLKKFSKNEKAGTPPFSLKEFGTAIHTADLNGNACKQEIIPERGDVLRLSLDENLEATAPTVAEIDNGADKNMNGIPDVLESRKSPVEDKNSNGIPDLLENGKH